MGVILENFDFGGVSGDIIKYQAVSLQVPPLVAIFAKKKGGGYL